MMSKRLSVLPLFLGLILVSSSLFGLSPISSVTIPGTSAGARTGLYLIAGDRVRLAATGQVNTLPPDSGNLATPSGNGALCTFECILPSAQFGALIGRIGEQGSWFLVGSNLTLNATQTGMLYLAVNDTIHANNTGSFTVSTSVTANASFSCAPSSTALCLRGDRFRVQVFWRLPGGAMGNAQVSGCGSSESGIFWFFDAANLELLVKVLDGCGINHSYWVFAAATTTVEFTLRVRDTHTGEVKMYFNPQGRPADALTDFSAFPGC
jgi:hypothetical protein